MLDATVLQGLTDDMGGDVEVVKELMQSFLDEAPKLLAEGRAALKANNVADVQRAYHTLKGNAATFGAMDLAAAARGIEHPAKTGVMPSPEQVAEVEALWEQVRKELLTRIG